MTVLQICQDNKLDFYDLMEAVEEFVDGFYDSPQIEIYEATAKKLLGAVEQEHFRCPASQRFGVHLIDPCIHATGIGCHHGAGVIRQCIHGLHR